MIPGTPASTTKPNTASPTADLPSYQVYLHGDHSSMSEVPSFMEATVNTSVSCKSDVLELRVILLVPGIWKQKILQVTTSWLASSTGCVLINFISSV